MYINLYSLSKYEKLGLTDVVGGLIWRTGFAIEVDSDLLLKEFLAKRKPNDPKFCKLGMWRYSRHPNYFGEILFWFSLYVFALASNLSFAWLLIGSIIMYALIAIASVSMMDKRSLERRPDFKEYMDSTPSILINIFKKG